MQHRCVPHRLKSKWTLICVSMVGGFRIDQVPRWVIDLVSPIADDRELQLWVEHRPLKVSN
jgi:hypothetical protein